MPRRQAITDGRAATAFALCAAAFTATANDFTAFPTGDFAAGPSWNTGLPPGPADTANINNGATATLRPGDALSVSALRLAAAPSHSAGLTANGGQLTINAALGTGSNYASFLGGGTESNGDGDATGATATLTLTNNALLDIDATAAARNPRRGDLQGLVLARGNSTAQATLQDNATLIVRQRLVLGGLASGNPSSFDGFDGQPTAGALNPGGAATLTMTGGILSTDHLVVGGSGSCTLIATAGTIETKAYKSTWDASANAGAGASNTSVNSIRIGMFAGSTGLLDVGGAASVSTGAELSVGHRGSGALVVRPGAAVSAAGDLVIGKFGTGTVHVSGGILSTAGELAIGGAGDGTLRITGDGAIVSARDITLQKSPGSRGKLVAEITGQSLTPIFATDHVTLNGGTFEVLPTDVPAHGAYRWDVIYAGLPLTGRFTNVSLPPDEPGAAGRTWSAVYEDYAFAVGLTIYGDADYNGLVNFDDLLALAKHYNHTAAQWPDGDFTRDGLVNFDDLLILAKNYNSTAPAAVPGASAQFNEDLAAAFAATVPEPSSLMAGIAMFMIPRRRRARV
jgi:T5SS/PEP-CTERM-associated repeat protein